MTYAPPEGFSLDPQSGKYYRYETIVDGQQWVTWFDANSGQYEQVSYPAPTAQPTPAVQPTAMATVPAPQPPAPVKAPVPATAQPVPTKKRGKGALVALIAIIVVIGGVFAGHYFGLYSLPFLTDTVNTVSVLETTGTVDIERDTDTLVARVGMRLENRDTVRTGGASSAWLSLDSDKAIGLAEQTSLRVDQSARGFELTLVAGEIRAQIDKPLADNEDFTVQAGNLALAVRGTVFTANYNNSLLNVNVESGTVAVLDADGREIAVLGAGESGAYEAGESPNSEQAFAANTAALSEGIFEGDSDTLDNYTGWGVWIYHNFRYEGYFVNGAPNGEGVLYETHPLPDNPEPDKTYALETILQGNFVDGLGHGAIQWTWFMDSGDVHVWNFDLANGYSTYEGKVYTASGTDLNLTTSILYGVPPWADVDTDASPAPPAGENAPAFNPPGGDSTLPGEMSGALNQLGYSNLHFEIDTEYARQNYPEALFLYSILFDLTGDTSGVSLVVSGGWQESGYWSDTEIVAAAESTHAYLSQGNGFGTGIFFNPAGGGILIDEYELGKDYENLWLVFSVDGELLGYVITPVTIPASAP